METRVPANPDLPARRTVRWITALFVMEVLFQRFATPGQAEVALLLPLLIIWAGLALRARLLEIDRRRLMFWLVAVAVSGLALVVQTMVLDGPVISVNSWLLFMAVWLVAATRFVDRRLSTYVLALRRIAAVCTALAVGCIFMMSVQLAGVRYEDYLGNLLPRNLLLHFFVTTYPVQFESPIYRANAWIGLEPSIVSFLLGLGVLAALLSRAKRWMTLVMVAGLVCAFSGSGFLVIAVGVLVMLAYPIRRPLRPYVLPAAVLGVVAVLTPFTQPLIFRATEATDSTSSTSLRAIQGYLELWPRWSADYVSALLGHGAGAAQRYAENLLVADLLVPTPARIIYDFGLLAGVVLIVCLVFFYLDGPCIALAITLFVSLWVIQSGASQAVFAIPVLLLVTLWAPRPGARLEDSPPLADPAARGRLSLTRFLNGGTLRHPVGQRPSPGSSAEAEGVSSATG